MTTMIPEPVKDALDKALRLHRLVSDQLDKMRELRGKSATGQELLVFDAIEALNTGLADQIRRTREGEIE